MYPGGKGSCFQQIINIMPPHRDYVEPFLGGGSVFLNKRVAPGFNFGLDLDPAALAPFLNDPRFPVSDEYQRKAPEFHFYQKNALDFLRESSIVRQGWTLVYCDPPYLMSSRRSQQDIYAHEFGSEEEHRELLDLLRSLKCMVMISGYWSDLYASMLHDWKYITFKVMTRAGTMADEFVWFNFQEPAALHDYSFLGDNFRERERIRRKVRRMTEKLDALPALERAALLDALTHGKSHFCNSCTYFYTDF